ncbi:MAG TPA: hypothetical protein GXZ70_01900 [Clostridiales bacterium]|jgi:hypothetical protein|nr:hypothetical protein [Clostridiales bacterium]
MSCSHGRRLWHCYPGNNGEDVVLRLKMADEKAGIVNKDYNASFCNKLLLTLHQRLLTIKNHIRME